MGRERMVFLVGAFARWVWTCHIVRRLGRKIRVLRYENMIHDPGSIPNAIHRLTGLEFEFGKVFETMAENSIGANRHRQQQVPLDPNAIVSPGHVHEGQVGTWRRFIADADTAFFASLISPVMNQLGYDND